MKDKRIWLAVLTILLVFGTVVTGCDLNGKGNGSANPFVGTWSGTIEGAAFRLVIT